MDNYEIPFVEKMTVSLLVIGHVDKEVESLRSTLEYFNYRVDTHWVGSKQELFRLMRCEIPTQDLVVINCHGDEHGILMMNGEQQVKPREIEQNCKMKGKIVICTGCMTGTEDLADSFISNGVLKYIAPIDYIDGDSCQMFLYQLFFSLKKKMPIERAIEKARAFDNETNLYKLFCKSEKMVLNSIT